MGGLSLEIKWFKYPIYEFGGKNYLWKRLFTDTVSVNKMHLTDTVSVNMMHLTDTEPVYKMHLTGTGHLDEKYIIGTIYHRYDMSVDHAVRWYYGINHHDRLILSI